MLAVGRKRTKNLHCPAGVREIEGRWHWQPTSQRERLERKEKGLPGSICLGDANTKGARDRWAQVSGFKDAKEIAGTVAELLTIWKRDGLKTRPNGRPRADETITAYTNALPALHAKFGKAKYGKTDKETSRGEAIGTAEIQRFVSESPKAMGNRYLAVLNNAFDHGVRNNKTTYNPCKAAIKNASKAREREPEEWEVECLRTLASPVMALLIDYEGISALRISSMLELQRVRLTPPGIRVLGKGGKREVREWTPESRRIIADAERLPGATKFPASPLFPAPSGRAIDYDSFDKQWQALKRLANAELALCEIPLVIPPLHFHDLRSKAHDDAIDAGMDGAEFINDTQAVANKHYHRRTKRKPHLR